MSDRPRVRVSNRRQHIQPFGCYRYRYYSPVTHSKTEKTDLHQVGFTIGSPPPRWPREGDGSMPPACWETVYSIRSVLRRRTAHPGCSCRSLRSQREFSSHHLSKLYRLFSRSSAGVPGSLSLLSQNRQR